MHSFSSLVVAFTSTWVLAAAQMNTLPECVTTCLHNTIPQCSGIKCYCQNLNSTALTTATSCYHALCDSTAPDPFDVFMADVSPLCFQQGSPIQQDQIDAASAVESASSFSTYLSLSDGGVRNASMTATTTSTIGVQNMVVTGGSVLATTTGTQSAGFGAMAGPSSSVSMGGAGRGRAEGRDGVVTGLVMGMAGILLQIAG